MNAEQTSQIIFTDNIFWILRARNCFQITKTYHNWSLLLYLKILLCKSHYQFLFNWLLSGQISSFAILATSLVDHLKKEAPHFNLFLVFNRSLSQ